MSGWLWFVFGFAFCLALEVVLASVWARKYVRTYVETQAHDAALRDAGLKLGGEDAIPRIGRPRRR